MKKTVLLFAIIIFSNSFGQSSLWNKTSEEATRSLPKMDRGSIPSKFELYSLNFQLLKEQLQQSPLDSQNIPSNVVISFPNPSGELEAYTIYEAPVMEQGLSDKFPGLKSYSGKSITNPAQLIRFSITLFGLHVMSFGSGTGTFYIDTYTKDLNHYIVYNRNDVRPSRSFECLVTDQTNDIKNKVGQVNSDRVSDGIFRTYRLAMACTIEYAAFHVNAAGLAAGTLAQKKAAVLSAMVVTMTRVNGVFENDMSLRMNLIANNELVIFIDSDSFDNANGGTLIDQSQTVIDATIGSANYDIGHTVSTGGGGLAQLNSPCTGGKARGITGLGSPVGDTFNIDYVAHEIGHQWGGNHTFNNSCGGNRNTSTAIEPGSGTTIMGYAGICAPDIQSNSDAYFHTISITEMTTFIISGAGGNCDTPIVSGNTAPVANAGSDFTIPKGTPFILKGAGTDSNGDTLTYCWEQIDIEATTQPPTQTATGGPNFRSLYATTSPNRYMPTLASVVAGVLNPTWEVVPTVARTNMDFALTVRDNRTPNGGQTQRDNMVLTIANVGPFLVTSPNTAVSYIGLTNQTITWDAAGTTANGINCANVDILLSTNGGLTFPTTLLAGTPNDGSQSVTIPNTPGTTNRIMIAGSNHIFYDVSNANFTITNAVSDSTPPSPPTLSASGTTPTTTNLSWSGATDNIGVTGYDIYRNGLFLATTTSSPYTAINLIPSTNYTFFVRAKDGSGNVSVNSNTVNVLTLPPDTVPPSPPTLSASSTTSTTTNLSWSGATDNFAVTAYEIYKDGVFLTTVSASPYLVTGLSILTTYSFTVKSKDDAGNTSANSNVVTITTSANYCASQGNSVVDELIGNVQLGTINNPSTGGTGYTDFTAISTNLILGSTNTITITPTWTGTIYNEAYAVFIDYNRDGDFLDAGETVYTRTATTATPIVGTFTVPTNVAFIGSTRMRVSMKYGAAGSAPPTSCEVFAYGQVEDYTVNIVAANTLITTKLYIEGFYDTITNFMLPVRANQGVGVSATDVDTITLELRNATAPHALAATTTAMLQTNGIATGTFTPAITGSYYLVVKHRNGLQTWSASPITVSASTPTYDFTNTNTKAYGLNMKQVEPGVWALYSGDINQDEVIDASDNVNLANDISNSNFGYLNTDLNGDGSVDNSDLPIITNNIENSVFSNYP